MEPRIQTLRGAAIIIGALIFTMVALAATPQTSPADCMTHQQVREALERSRNGISLSCNETIRQHNIQSITERQGRTMR